MANYTIVGPTKVESSANPRWCKFWSATGTEELANQSWTLTVQTHSVSLACDIGRMNGVETSNTGGLTTCNMIYNCHAARVQGTATSDAWIYSKVSIPAGQAIAGKTIYACNKQTEDSSWYSAITCYDSSLNVIALDQPVTCKGYTVPSNTYRIRVGCMIKAGTTFSATTDLNIGVVCPAMNAMTYTYTGNGRGYNGMAYGDTWSVEMIPATNYIAGTITPSSGTATDNIQCEITPARIYAYDVEVDKPTIKGNLRLNMKVTLNHTYSDEMPIAVRKGTTTGLNNPLTDDTYSDNLSSYAYTIQQVPLGSVVTVKWTANTGYTYSAATASSRVSTQEVTHTVSTENTGFRFIYPGATGSTAIAPTLWYPKLTVNAMTYGSYSITFTPGANGGTAPANVTNKSDKGEFNLPYGCTYEITYTKPADTAQYSYTWTERTDSDSLTAAKTITPPTITRTTNQYTVTLSQGTGTTLTVKKTNSSGTAITSGTKYDYGTKIYVAGSANTGYTSLELTQGSTVISSGGTFTLTGDVTISSTAVVSTYAVSVPAPATGIASYKITITKGSLGTMPSGYTSGSASAAKTAATSVSVPHGSTVKVDWTATAGYSLSKTTETESSITAAKSFTNPTATVITKTITIPAVTTGIASYTITVTKGTLGSMPTCKDSSGTAISLTSGTASTAQTKKCTLTGVPYGTTVKATWTKSTGYSLSKTTQSETVANATASTFTNPTATLITRTVTIPLNGNCLRYRFKVTLNTTYTSTMPSAGGSIGNTLVNDTYTDYCYTDGLQVYSVPYGAKVTVEYTAKEGYTYATAATSDTPTKTVTMPAVTNTTAYTFTQPTAQLRYCNLTVGATTNQTYKVTGTLNSTYGGTLPTADTSGSTVGIASARSTQGVFSFPYGSTAKVTYTSSNTSVYTASSAVTKTMTSNQTVAAASATAKTFTFTITSGSNQTITVTRTGGTASADGNSSWTSTFNAPYGMEWSASIAGAGVTPSGKAERDALFEAYNQVTTNQTLVIPSDVDQIYVLSEFGDYAEPENMDTYEAQDGYCYINNVLYENGAIVNVTPGSTITYRLTFGNNATWDEMYVGILVAHVIPSYYPGVLSATSGTVTGAYTLTATEAIPTTTSIGAGVYWDNTNQVHVISDTILPSVTRRTSIGAPTMPGLITNLQNNIVSTNTAYYSYELHIPQGVTKVMYTANVGWDDSTKGFYQNARVVTSNGEMWHDGGGRNWPRPDYRSASGFEQIVGYAPKQYYCTEGTIGYCIHDVTPGATYKLTAYTPQLNEHIAHNPGFQFIMGPKVTKLATRQVSTGYADTNATLTVTGSYTVAFEHIYSPTTKRANGNLAAGTYSIANGSIIKLGNTIRLVCGNLSYNTGSPDCSADCSGD